MRNSLVDRSSTSDEDSWFDEDARVALREAEARWGTAFGRASRKELARAATAALQGQSRGGATPQATLAGIEQCHVARHGKLALRAELEDEVERDAARRSDAALVTYEAKWSARLERMQRTQPGRWSVREFSAEELRAELTLSLIELVIARDDEFERYERAGREFGFSFLLSARAALRRKYRLRVELTEPTVLADPVPTLEERLIAEQTRAVLGLAGAAAERALSRPQRRWLSALKLSANAGAFFESSGRVNLAAASRLLQKNRSSAKRAFAELQRQFQAELEKLV
ncbi:MAG TPA: hypothetical protein VFQ35_01425 [Polyangiaceae bacterium]|nr:hypothetical protein [Polyangiaceae bacterium]